MPLEITSFVLEASTDYPYHITVKRYSDPRTQDPSAHDASAITLVLTHATGMHKESWEIVMRHLFEKCSLPGSTVKIRDAWTIDSINHGDAALLNEEILRTNFTETFSWDNYGYAVGRFLLAGEERGARVDFSKRNLYAMGHSMGATSLVWAQRELGIFKSLILVEPMLTPPGKKTPRSAGERWVVATYQRQDVWPSRKAAAKDLLSTRGYKHWDPAMIELFVTHALRPHPASAFSVFPYNGVVLSCSRFHEAACYRGGGPFMGEMGEALIPISGKIPVHFIWGGIKDAISQPFQEALGDESQSGIKAASSRSIPGVGHLALQVSPLGVADAVMQVLLTEAASRNMSSRL
ncbi:hypothetical protein FRB97_007107 [Tulasnella sp. 331]|nr:hypothetical protein FRB97_007107 [Tulasnella sp. 331]